MIVGGHHIAICVSEREAALAFYRDALGFCVCTETVRPEKGDVLLFLEGYGMRLELFVDPRRPARPSYPEALGLRHLCFAVQDLEGVRNKLLSLGYSPEPIRPAMGGCAFFVKDPDGLPVEFHM